MNSSSTVFKISGESLPPEYRSYLLDLFSKNGVDSVFSGHTHFENTPLPYEGIQQYILTSINYLSSWTSLESGNSFGPQKGNNKRGFYLVSIENHQKPKVRKINL